MGWWVGGLMRTNANLSKDELPSASWSLSLFQAMKKCSALNSKPQLNNSTKNLDCHVSISIELGLSVKL